MQQVDYHTHLSGRTLVLKGTNHVRAHPNRRLQLGECHLKPRSARKEPWIQVLVTFFRAFYNPGFSSLMQKLEFCFTSYSKDRKCVSLNILLVSLLMSSPSLLFPHPSVHYIMPAFYICESLGWSLYFSHTLLQFHQMLHRKIRTQKASDQSVVPPVPTASWCGRPLVQSVHSASPSQLQARVNVPYQPLSAVVVSFLPALLSCSLGSYNTLPQRHEEVLLQSSHFAHIKYITFYKL